MATVDNTLGTSPPMDKAGHGYTVQRSYDFATNNQSSADVIQMIYVPADTLVTHVIYECLTAEGGTLTFNVGDATDVDGWDATVNGNDAAGPILGDGAFADGKIYHAADTLDIVLTADADAAKVAVTAVMVPIGQPS